MATLDNPLQQMFNKKYKVLQAPLEQELHFVKGSQLNCCSIGLNVILELYMANASAHLCTLAEVCIDIGLFFPKRVRLAMACGP